MMRISDFPCRTIEWKLLLLLLGFWLGLWAAPARAQFATTTATRFVCNATGNQLGVQAFADGAGGSFSVWIDQRNGNRSGLGTGIYAQHLNAAGVVLLPANGLRLYQAGSREIFWLRAIPWNSGMLVAWVQGAFGVGGDTLRCQYYSSNGAPQWAQPTVVSTKAPNNIIYVGVNGLNIIPTSTGGATITFDAATLYAGDQFAFNQVSSTGVLRWALNSQNVIIPNATYFHTTGDGNDGFYLVGSTGGLGTAIVAQRFTAAGTAAWAAQTVISAGGASGRGSDWQLLTDPANNLYVAWTSNGGDPLASKVLPGGALGWASPGYVALSTDPAFQTKPDAIWHDNALWMIWEDARGGTGSFDYKCYAQKIDAAGSLAWTANGVPVYGLSAGAPRPKLAPSDNGAVMAFYTTDTNGANFRAQKILPTGSLAFAAPGVVLHSVADNKPYELDYVPVGQPNGSVQVYWSSPGAASTGRDICVGRMQNSGTLLGAENSAEALGFVVYPNPAGSELKLQALNGSQPGNLRLFDARGRLVRSFAEAPALLSVRGLPAGLYVLRATVAGQEVSRRVAVE
jgi:hypothetical protein